MKNILIGVLVFGIALLGLTYLNAPKVEAPKPVVVGSVTGPELSSPFWTVDGVTHEYRSTTFSGSTSTPCSWLSPSSTSTLLYTSLQISNSTNTALLITLATSSTMNATGTSNRLISEAAVGADVKAVLHYNGTTTSAVVDEPWLDTLAPRTYLTWGIEGIGGYTNPSEFGGTCKAEFLVN